MENGIEMQNLIDNWITQKLKFFVCLSPVNFASCRIYYCEKYTITITITITVQQIKYNLVIKNGRKNL